MFPRLFSLEGTGSMRIFLLRAWLSGVAVLVAPSSIVVAQTSRSSPPTVRSTLTLEEVLSTALKEHPLIQSARARVDAARGSRQAAGTLPNPIVTYSVEDSAFPGQGPVRLDAERSAYITYPLESLFQRPPRIERADQAIHEAEAELVGAERRVAREVTRAFYKVALAQVALVAVQESKSAVDRLVDYLRARVSQGASPEAELIRAEVERDQTATEVSLADAELVRARAELQPFLGTSFRALDALQVDVADPPTGGPELPPLDEFTRHAAQRPELVTARARLAMAQATVAHERRLVIREVGASFGLKRTSGINSMIAGVSLSVPLFDRNRGEIARATAEQIALEQELAWIERSVTAEVNGAYEVSRRLSAQLAALQRTFLNRADESSRITFAAYQEGAATLLQALDASRMLAAARLIYSRAHFAQRESLFDLRLAAGYDPRDGGLR
jgi:cobalt-zinc-cadmium efflux system outer membrane protein